MTSSFSAVDYIARIARQLIFAFEDASQAGTPGLIGSAREHPARQRLELLLPAASALGSGIVIDSYGGASRQQDLVIFERANCPVYTINDTSESTYFPCEGVIAVGEVKSKAGSKELDDAFSKIASAKRLRRHAVASTGAFGLPPAVSFRLYGNTQSLACVVAEQFDQSKEWKDQIFGFMLCGEFSLSRDALLAKVAELWSSVPQNEAPNYLVSLRDGFIQPANNGRLLPSVVGATEIILCDDNNEAFVQLLRRLLSQVRHGRTVDLKHFDRYLLRNAAPSTFRIVARSSLARSE